MLGHSVLKGFNFIDQAVYRQFRILQLTFPDDENLPTVLTEQALILSVTVDILCELSEPKLSSGGRHASALAAIVPVPVASVNENDRTVPWKHDVGPAGQILDILAKPETGSMEQTAHELLRACVAAPNLGHIQAALSCTEVISRW